MIIYSTECETPKLARWLKMVSWKVYERRNKIESRNIAAGENLSGFIAFVLMKADQIL